MRTPRRQNMMGPKNQGSGEKAKDFKSAIKRLIKELSSLRGIIVFALILAIISAILSIAAPNKLSSITDVISEGLVINKENAEILAKTIQKNITKATEEMQAQLTIEIPAGFEMQNIDETNMDSDLSAMQKPELPEIEMNGIKVSSEDQYEFIEQMSLLDENTEISDIYGEIDSMPENIKELLKPTMNIEKIKKISIFLLGLYICSALFNYIQSLCMTDVANKFAKTLRTRISHKINKLPLKYFDKHQSGDILSRVTNDVDTIAQTMNNSLGMLVSSITLFIGSIIMMFWTNWIMALTAIISSLLGFAGMTYVLKKSQKYFDIRQIELGNLNGHIEEIYSGLNVVKAYNGQKECNKKFDYLNKKLKEANRKSQFLSGLMQPMMGFVGNFGYVAVCIVGALLAMNNHITFGVIVAFITYVRLFTNPLAQIAQAITSLQSTAAASERVFEFVDEKEMIDESNLKGKIEKTQAKGKIEFLNIYHL